MADIKWIKISTDMFANRKIKVIETMDNANQIIVIWVKLLCLAGQSTNPGIVSITDKVPYTKKMLSSIFNVELSTMCNALVTLQDLDMIKIDTDFIEIINWDKYQASNKMEIIKEQTRERVRKYREKNKLLKQQELEKCNVTGNGEVTVCNDIEVRSKKKDVRSKNISISLSEDVTLQIKTFYPDLTDRQILLIKNLVDEFGEDEVKEAIEKAAIHEPNDPISYIKRILKNKVIFGDMNVL